MTKVSDILAQRRRRALERRDARVWDIYARFPELEHAHQERLRVGRELVTRAMFANPKETETLRQRLAEAEAAEKQARQAAGLTDAAFEPDYFCPDCEDTGFVNGVSCHCRNKLLVEQRYQMSAVSQRIQIENFDTFNLSLFRRDVQPGEFESPFENMRQIRKQMEEEYVPYFESATKKASPNLYFYGPTGTGKTFLVNAIVKALLDRGHTVLYQTAPALLGFLAKDSFAFSSERTEDDVARRRFAEEADLLVIDDLGAEFSTEKTTAELFELLNARIVAARPTIISSNLRPEELRQVYNERIASRIAGEYVIYQLYGADLRRR